MAQTEEISTFKVDVELDTAEVLAIDKQGNPVPNLKKEDFQLYEDGKKQEILSVDEMTGKANSSSLGALPSNDEPRARGKVVLILFFDAFFNKSYRESAANFVRKHMDFQDLFAVASYGDKMKIQQNFTGDKESI